MNNKVAIVSIGNELINGFTIDSNSSWIARKISGYNLIHVEDKLTFKDDSDKIKKGIGSLLKREYRFIFITGGLGPTHDDITKSTLRDYFDCDLILNDEHLSNLRYRYGDSISSNIDLIKEQSKILSISNPIPNDKGIALGMIIQYKKTDILIMPGVPFEMKHMFHQYIVPLYIEPQYKKITKHITLLTTGVYESKLYKILKNIIDINKDKFLLSFLPAYTGVKVRLSLIDESASLSDFKNQVMLKIKKYVYGYNDDKMESIVGNILIDKGLTVAVAESCTGGYLSKKMTDIPNSSKYFIGSVIAYSNKIKIQYLDISSELLQKEGAVSREVALSMAHSIKNRFNADIGLSTTGISGPSGGTTDKPVGRIYIAIVFQNNQIVKEFNLMPERHNHRKIAVHVALNMLRILLKS